jgi:hypothetical protein
MALSLRDDPIATRPLTEDAGLPTIVALRRPDNRADENA